MSTTPYHSNHVLGPAAKASPSLRTKEGNKFSTCTPGAKEALEKYEGRYSPLTALGIASIGDFN